MTKTTKACINDDALTFETTLLDIQNRSTRRAWWVAGGACGLSLLLGCTIVLMQPLKTVVPYLVTVDKQTGYTEIQTVLTDATQLSQQEALDGYWVANYVRWHETYQWQSIRRLTIMYCSFPVIMLAAITLNCLKMINSRWSTDGGKTQRPRLKLRA